MDTGTEAEPMMNLLAWVEDGQWILCVMPRTLHRPACYFKEGDGNLLISPASVDLGGVFITPQTKDYEKITSHHIREILQEVCLSEAGIQEIIHKLTKSLQVDA